jgi:hypothetical protein
MSSDLSRNGKCAVAALPFPDENLINIEFTDGNVHRRSASGEVYALS